MCETRLGSESEPRTTCGSLQGLQGLQTWTNFARSHVWQSARSASVDGLQGLQTWTSFARSHVWQSARSASEDCLQGPNVDHSRKVPRVADADPNLEKDCPPRFDSYQADG
jgi:hypothetical protein